MKAFLVALSLFFTAPAFATEISPTEPPPFVPPLPFRTQRAAPSRPSLDLLRLMAPDEDEKPKAPDLKCDKHPCVFGYRFSGSVTEEEKDKLEAFMDAAVKAGADTVMLEINTPGGSMEEGHEMARIIEHAPVTVACVVDGKAASMGMYILQSCDVRVMTRRSFLMVHQVAFMIRGMTSTRLSLDTIEQLKASLEVSTRGYVEWCAHRMRLSAVQVLAKIDGGKEWFIGWEEAVKVGAVDRVLTDPPEAYFQQLKAGKP